jgi:hypothetical protein
MKKSVYTLIILSGLLICIASCKNKPVKDGTKTVTSVTEVITPSEITANFFLVGKDIISEVIVKPDTLGDPWEVEKVKNYNGKTMLTHLFENIYSKKITVYDIMTGQPLDPEEIRKTEKEYGSDISKIGKLQFLEDWYFDPSTNKIIKKIKSVSFAYKYFRESGLPVAYKPLFKLNIVQ